MDLEKEDVEFLIYLAVEYSKYRREKRKEKEVEEEKKKKPKKKKPNRKKTPLTSTTDRLEGKRGEKSPCTFIL